MGLWVQGGGSFGVMSFLAYQRRRRPPFAPKEWTLVPFLPFFLVDEGTTERAAAFAKGKREDAAATDVVVVTRPAVEHRLLCSILKGGD